MALSQLYYVDGNVAYPDISSAANVMRSHLWNQKALLTGQVLGTNGTSGAAPAGLLFSCQGSSDGATAALDGTDRWTATFTPSKLVRAAAGVAHSWWSGYLATLGLYVCLDWSGASDTVYNIITSKTAFTGGSITARPTSSVELLYTGVIPSVALTATKSSRIIGADGTFYLLSAATGSGRFDVLFGATKMSEPRAGDSYTEATMLDYGTTGRGAGLATVFIPGGFSANTRGVAMRSVGGGATAGANSAGFIIPDTSTTSSTVPNPADGKFDLWPCYYQFRNPTPEFAIRGRWRDVFWVNQGKSVGDVEPLTGASERVIVGNFCIPNGGLILTV